MSGKENIRRVYSEQTLKKLEELSKEFEKSEDHKGDFVYHKGDFILEKDGRKHNITVAKYCVYYNCEEYRCNHPDDDMRGSCFKNNKRCGDFEFISPHKRRELSLSKSY